MTPREAAYLSLLASLRHENFISNILEDWQRKDNPSTLDYGFAQEISYGSARMALALDYMAAALSTNKKLTLKLKERALLRTALYQHSYMTKVPLYAILNETLNLAKKHCHHRFASFLNALLRRLADGTPQLPQGMTPEALSLQYSYPADFIKKLIAELGPEKALEVLQIQNKAPEIIVRLRPNAPLNPSLRILKGIPAAVFKKGKSLTPIITSKDYYIQNATPIALVQELSKHPQVTPKRILDLCASPGGKLLAAHDLFPQAELFANDVSPDKVHKLAENLHKYGVEANLTCGPGEEYASSEPFDLIILDVPCSNSGVLNKRPEARWRLNRESLGDLKEKQLALLSHAATLCAKDGLIWYLTCSILKEENDQIAQQALEYGLKLIFSKTILPNSTGYDGGYAALLSRIP